MEDGEEPKLRVVDPLEGLVPVLEKEDRLMINAGRVLGAFLVLTVATMIIASFAIIVVGTIHIIAALI